MVPDLSWATDLNIRPEGMVLMDVRETFRKRMRQSLISLGFIFLAGLAFDAVGRRTKLPRVTLLLLFGILVGQHPVFNRRRRPMAPLIM